MRLIDMHCDTISELCHRDEETLYKNKLCIDIDGMRQSKTQVQFFACFVSAASFAKRDKQESSAMFSDAVWNQAFEAILGMSDRLDQEQSEDLRVVRSYNDILKNTKKNVISALKTVEEGGVMNGDIARLEALYERGVRLITLTWNYANCLGFPNSRDSEIMKKGLTTFGKQVVEVMNDKGMLVDVSHLSEGGFWECLKVSRVPVCASHSNARGLCNHPRNLSDEMLKALGEKGGVAGLNFYPMFLREGGNATLEDIARHGAYMIQKGGEDVVALGTDFDGFENQPHDHWIGHVRDMDRVWDVMKEIGITERQLDKITSENAMRLLGQMN